jgi:hypothetical protein
MRNKLAIGVASGFCLLASVVIVAKAVDMAPLLVEADSGWTVELYAADVAGVRLDGTSKATRWWDGRKEEVLSRLLDRPRRWSNLLEDWSDHILSRVMTLGAPGIGLLYMMLMLSFSLVHAFPQRATQRTAPQKTARKARPKGRDDHHTKAGAQPASSARLRMKSARRAKAV